MTWLWQYPALHRAFCHSLKETNRNSLIRGFSWPPQYFLHSPGGWMVGGEVVLSSISSKGLWEIQVSAARLRSKALNVVKSVFVTMFKQKKLSGPEWNSCLSDQQQARGAVWALPRIHWRNHWSHSILCKQSTFHPGGEYVLQGQLGAPLYICFVPYRWKENVWFAYESMGLVRLKDTLNNNV